MAGVGERGGSQAKGVGVMLSFIRNLLAFLFGHLIAGQIWLYGLLAPAPSAMPLRRRGEVARLDGNGGWVIGCKPATGKVNDCAKWPPSDVVAVFVVAHPKSPHTSMMVRFEERITREYSTTVN